MRQAVIQKAEERQRRQQPNLTGIPTQMKMDFEQRSGLSFDDGLYPDPTGSYRARAGAAFEA